jgi:hypothetical protein
VVGDPVLRLFLDAHLSSHSIAAPLRTEGHDIRCVDEESELEGLPDEPLLALATTDTRVLVTANVKDFVPILAAWASVQRSHAGCILIPRSIPHGQFGAIQGLRKVLADVPEQSAWLDLTLWLPR